MTLGRDKQPTLEAMPRSVLKDVRLVVQPHEKDKHNYDVKKIILPKEIDRIHTTREWLFKHTDTDKMFLLDDDLSFFARKSDSDWHLVKLNEHGMETMLSRMTHRLEYYNHVSISCREGNNRVEKAFKLCGRAIRAVGYRTEVVSKLENIARLRFMSDFDVTLRLLRLGHANYISYMYAQNHGGSNAPGGCSLTRTSEELARSAEGLYSFHKEYVKLVEKETKGSWGGGKRLDVTVQWKKAYLSNIYDILK